MTDYEKRLLKYIIRQNDRILRYVKQDLDVDAYNLERTFEMADNIDTVIADVAKSTEINEGTAIVVDHAVSLLDDIAAKLKEAGVDPAKLEALHTSITSNSANLEAKKGELAAAVERNTPFDPSANGQ